MNVRFFLSSSSEQLPIGKALEANLAADGFEPTLWSREAHGASQYNLEALLGQAASSDFAIFVFAPDDQVTIRGKKFGVVRDNVLFELGVFIGKRGRDRCFIVRVVETPMRLPSDLDGLTALEYDHRRSDENLRRSLGPVTTTIADLARTVAAAAASDLSDNELRLLQSSKDPACLPTKRSKRSALRLRLGMTGSACVCAPARTRSHQEHGINGDRNYAQRASTIRAARRG